MRDNVLNAIGDVLLIDVKPKMTGNIQLTDFSDVVEGVTSTRTLRKEFRISPDEVFWSEWKELTAANLASEGYQVDGEFTIQLRYTRTGTDTTGTIAFKSIDFTGSTETSKFNFPTIDASIFDKVFGTQEMKTLERNIFKKLYFRGIIPNYIIRGDNADSNEDRDYVDFFFSMARFYSMFICFFKRFENFQNDYDLMLEQVRQYGIYFDDGNISLEDLQYLAQNIFDQIRQRGTDMIFKRKGYVLPSGEELPIDGEFIRLTRSKVSDELLYENMPLEKVGWCMGQCSPLYRGTAMAELLNKTKENTKDFQSLSNFFISKTSGATYSLENLDSKKVLQLKVNSSGTVGLGRVSDSLDAKDFLYVADSNLDYEITFALKITGTASANSSVIFGVEGFDNLKNKLSDSFITPNGFSISETFFQLETNKVKSGIWYFVRGIIHAYSTTATENTPTNIGYGNNLYFNNPFVKYMLPKIQLTGTTSAEVAIWDYKIKPLVRGTNILPLRNGKENSMSLGFIQSSRIFFSYVRNNNTSNSTEEITDIIEKYLLPYNVTDIFVFTNNS